MHTNGMKIAISVPDEVFREIERIAGERNVSRSQVFTEAAREYIRKAETRLLVDRLNEAYSSSDTGEEKSEKETMAAYQRRRAAGKKPW
jgi:metal-responsive CopG/Arc/MetJ family transcriptional regulator